MSRETFEQLDSQAISRKVADSLRRQAARMLAQADKLDSPEPDKA